MRMTVGAAALFLIPALCPAAVLDFEGFAVNTFLTTEYQASAGIVFLENARIHHLGTNHATSGILGLYNSGATISAKFTLPGDVDAVTDSVLIKGDLIPIGGNVTLQAYDINGNLIGTDVKPDSPAPATLSITTPGIHRIAFFAQSGTVAFDDLTFTSPVAAGDPTTGVPEPTSAMLLLSGAVGMFASRRFLRSR